MSSKTKANAKFSIYSTSDRTPMHFACANSFPVGCYDTLLNGLSQKYSISSIWHKGLCPGSDSPPSSLSWDDYADDLIRHLKSQYKQPVIGVGHSMGATITLLAAAKAPKLFSQVVLVEPVILSKWQALLGKYAPRSFLNAVEPVKSSLHKESQWANKDKALAYFKRQPAYQKIPADQLKIMIEAMTEAESGNPKGNVSLTYPLDWEVANYLSGQCVAQEYQKLKVPTAVIRGKPSVFVHDKTWHQMMRVKPKAVYLHEMEFGHLIPFESPQLTRQLIMMAIKKLKDPE